MKFPNATKIIATVIGLWLFSAIPLWAQEPVNQTEVLKSSTLGLSSILRGMLGMVCLIGIAYLFSANRKAIRWKTVGIGLGLQFLLALGVLQLVWVQNFFSMIGQLFLNILDYTLAGSQFLLGNLLDLNNPSIGYIFAFQILPTIIFFSALTSVLFYLVSFRKWFEDLRGYWRSRWAFLGLNPYPLPGTSFWDKRKHLYWSKPT